jgi:plasmid stabilization system protein ParE
VRQIWDFIALDKPEAADRFSTRLYETFRAIGRSPGIGHVRHDIETSCVLFFPVGSYLIIYRTASNVVEILAVVHGARDIPAFLARRGLN